MPIKLLADVHSSIAGIEARVDREDTLLVLGDVLGLVDWVDFSGILPEVLGPDLLREMLFSAFAKGPEAARRMREELFRPEGEYYELLQARVEEDYREFRRVLESIGCRTLVIFGNSDIPEAMRDIFAGSPSVEMADETLELEGRTFGFLPGSVKSPFEMPGESDDEFLRRRLAAMGRVDVLCAHIPPDLEEVTFDVVAGRNQSGSGALLDYVRELEPACVYHGHVHQPAQRVFNLGATRLINVGYYKRQRYVHVHGE